MHPDDTDSTRPGSDGSPGPREGADDDESPGVDDEPSGDDDESQTAASASAKGPTVPLRYRMVRLSGGGAVVYDRENEDAWIESDRTVPLPGSEDPA